MFGNSKATMGLPFRDAFEYDAERIRYERERERQLQEQMVAEKMALMKQQIEMERQHAVHQRRLEEEQRQRNLIDTRRLNLAMEKLFSAPALPENAGKFEPEWFARYEAEKKRMEAERGD